MVAATPRTGSVPLRQHLKARTRTLHQTLDSALGDAAIADTCGYGAFLLAQYGARAPIERWTRASLPVEMCPPAVAPLIAADLSELAYPLPVEAAFAFPAGGEALGAVWALGGSSLGNEALLSRRRRAGQSGADRFLSDAGMARYFRRILPLLESTVPADRSDAAFAAAEAVFRAFLAAAGHSNLRSAA